MLFTIVFTVIKLQEVFYYKTNNTFLTLSLLWADQYKIKCDWWIDSFNFPTIDNCSGCLSAVHLDIKEKIQFLHSKWKIELQHYLA